GGSRIITSVFEELSNVVDFRMGVADAVRAPRFHQQDSPDVILLEPHSLPEDIVAALRSMGHETKETEHLADAPGIGRAMGLWEAGTEPRRDGGLGLGL
ncbi:MAG TPA: gamma-glutamyltransferase, partial [Polyangiaceae bacterium]